MRLIRVRLAGQLKDVTKGAREVRLESARDLNGIFTSLESAYPGVARRIMDDQGRIRRYVNVFVNSENSRCLDNEKTILKDGDVVHILPSVAGG